MTANAIATSQTRELLPQLNSMEEAMAVANSLAKSNIIPAAFTGKPSNILIAMMWAKSLNIPVIQTLNSIAVINGKPSLYGDLLKGLVFQSGQCEDFAENWDPQTKTATCRIKRKGLSTPIETSFSFADAAKAGLLTKAGPWKVYPARMCKMRARAFAIRDAFPDILMGLSVAEEAEDIGGADNATAAAALEPAPAARRPRRKSAAAPADVQDVVEQPAAKAIEHEPEPAPVTEAAPLPDAPEIEEVDVIQKWGPKISGCATYTALVELWRAIPVNERDGLREIFEQRKNEIVQPLPQEPANDAAVADSY